MLFISSGTVAGYPHHPFEDDDDALIDREQEAADAFDCAINEIKACMAKVRVQQGGADDPEKCFENALNGMADSISDLEHGKRLAMEAVRNA